MGGAESELIEVLERLCAAFAERDADAVIDVFAPNPDISVVTSEASLLRGPVELQHFLDRYVDGRTTYSWEWDRHDVSIAGSIGWILAEGIESAATEDGVEQHPYRMTMVLERRDDRWLVRQVHGSSPH